VENSTGLMTPSTNKWCRGRWKKQPLKIKRDLRSKGDKTVN
jgi:hypothetical protein